MARKSGRTREGRRWVRDAGVGRVCSPTDVTFRTGNSGEAQALRTEKARTLVEEARRRGPVKKREMVLSREEKHRQGWPVPRGERGQGPPLVRDGAVLGFSAPALLTSLSAIRVVSSAYLRLLIFLLAILNSGRW